MNQNENPLVNRVQNSGLITINLEEYFPDDTFAEIDLKDFLWKELILKEKDFRLALKELDWTTYEGKTVLVFCSTDAILPVWSFMLLSAYLTPHCQEVYLGDRNSFISHRYEETLKEMDCSIYEGKRVVIKGCSDKDVPPSAYLALTKKLQPFAQSIMYGEPCSTVPIFKRPRKLMSS